MSQPSTPPKPDAPTSVALVAPPPDESEKFALLQRQAKLMCNNPMLPEHFRGEGNIPAVVMAIDLAKRIDVSVYSLMNETYMVGKTAGFKGKFMAAIIQSPRSRFEELDYEHEHPGDAVKWRCRCTALSKKTGKQHAGPWASMKMAKSEGWLDRNPKWSSMPELMLQYRAAAFFARAYCSDLIMGMLTAEELEDIRGGGSPVNDLQTNPFAHAPQNAGPQNPQVVDVELSDDAA